MEVKGVNGNLLECTADVLLQVVNCKNAMNSGVAKAIREKYPIVYEKYHNACDAMAKKGYETKELLGRILPVKVTDKQEVINLFAEDAFGYDGKRYVSYDALITCFEKTAEYCKTNNFKVVGLPYKLGSCRGGADWDVVWTMLKSVFKDMDVTLEVWKLDAE